MAVPPARRSRSTREQPFGVARAEAGRRLVEDQQAGVHREGARDRDELLLRGGQAAAAACAATRLTPMRPAAARCRRPCAGDRAAAAARRECGSRPRNTLPATSSVSISSSSWWMTAMPSRAASAGSVHGRPARRRCGSRRSRRDGCRPGIFISVDLPAPFSPTSADDLAGRHVEVHAVERDDAGKALGDRRHLQ